MAVCTDSQIKRTGYTQYADDKELNKRQKEELRPEDPMYEYFLSKREEEEEIVEADKRANNEEENSKPQVSDFTKESKKPKYREPLWHSSRIPMGRHQSRERLRGEADQSSESPEDAQAAGVSVECCESVV